MFDKIFEGMEWRHEVGDTSVFQVGSEAPQSGTIVERWGVLDDLVVKEAYKVLVDDVIRMIREDDVF